MASQANITNINNAAVNNDVLRWKIGELELPRVLSDYVFEDRPIYTNVNTTQSGVTSQDFVRFQLYISNVSFDYVTIEQYQAILRAMKLTRGSSGGGFNMTYFDFQTGKYETKTFIVKSLPATIKRVIGKGDIDSGTVNISNVRLQLKNISFQEV